MKLNFNFPITDLSGQPIEQAIEMPDKSIKKETLFMHKIFANTMISPNVKEGDVIKKNVLAEEIYQKGEIEVDEADFMLIKKIAELPDIFAPRVKYLLSSYLNTVK
jgi:hypothetical protein